VLRDAGIEAVDREEILTFEEPKMRFGHNQVQITGLGADRAVALGDGDLAGRENLEGYAAAVAAAAMGDFYSRCRIQMKALEPARRVKSSATKP
jgi:hypothetical protein